MSTGEANALLERLLAQFAEPYDFLRELVQNALDAGSDRAEVTLETHPAHGGDADEVVFELRVSDAGGGMDEAIIDRGLTRLFATTKADDRTMAGGYGVGFVSVFAWQPEIVLVHTGRGGEAWELVFHADRRFEKLPLAEPVEGTTVTLLRRGRDHERPAIAEAIRDSLWRWCRFCELELTFEDVASGEPPELLQDRPTPGDTTLTVADTQADTTVHVAFAVPPTAVLLRRGLILAEGLPKDLLGTAVPQLGSSSEHIQVWVDSPALRTTIARDKVLDDPGQRAVLARVATSVATLRQRLLSELMAIAADDAPWTRDHHDHYTYLHAHLHHELPAIGPSVAELPILRDISQHRPISPAQLATQLRGRPVLLAEPEEPHPLLCRVTASGLPVLPAIATDLAWLAPLLGTQHTVFINDSVHREIAVTDAEDLRLAVERGLTAAGISVGLCLAEGPGQRPGLVGLEITSQNASPADPGAIVLHAHGPWPESAWRGATVWVADGMLLRAARKTFATAPQSTALTLACAVAAALTRTRTRIDDIASALATV